jgi:2-iminobutanoate/2-iminopropanoate deaminase
MGLVSRHTNRAPAAVGPYSQAIQAGSWLFVSGQIPLRPGAADLVSESFPDQARQVLENLRAILEDNDYTLADVVAVDAFLVDLSQFAVFNEIYSTYFTDHRPARAAVEVKALPKGAQIEMKCIAWRE